MRGKQRARPKPIHTRKQSIIFDSSTELGTARRVNVGKTPRNKVTKDQISGAYIGGDDAKSALNNTLTKVSGERSGRVHRRGDRSSDGLQKLSSRKSPLDNQHSSMRENSDSNTTPRIGFGGSVTHTSAKVSKTPGRQRPLPESEGGLPPINVASSGV